MPDNSIPKSTNLLNSNKLSLYNTPSSNMDLPQPASVEPTLKPYTNGAIAAKQVSTLVSGALGMMANYTNYKYQARALNAQADSYLGQMPLNYAAYRSNAQYLAEQNFANVSRVLEERDLLAGLQMAGIANSGFDMSAGEQRIIKDTYAKASSDIYLQNRSAYLQAFEMWRSTEMENNRLLAAAATARNQAKFAKKMAKINLISGTVSTAAGVMSAGYGPYLANPKGGKNNA